jgi:hypothetical protein
MRVARISWEHTGHSWDILHKAKGDDLGQVHSDQNVLEMIRRGRPVLVIRGKESQSSSRDHQAPTKIRWFL